MRKHLLQSWLVTSYQKLMEQGKPALIEDGSCAYNNDLGYRCGVGHLLDNVLIDPDDQSMVIRNLLKLPEVENVLQNPTSDEIEFLSELQKCHDSASHYISSLFKERLKEKYELLAMKYELEFNYSGTPA
jgi:hypothetical protein